MMKRILVVDDNPDILDALDLLLSLHDYQVVTASSVKEAVLIVTRQKIDLVLQDMNFDDGITSGNDGKSLFYDIKQSTPDLPVILMTAWGQLETAIELVKAGAADYLAKPWDDTKLLAVISEHLVKIPTTVKTATNLSHRGNEAHSSDSNEKPLVYQSLQMQQLVEMANKVAQSDINVFISGANGSGKEKLADHIHQQSKRAHRPFIKVNMGALPAQLMEAELFGAEKGAFTGANNARIGRFEAADGGTLFLDEIGNLSLIGQTKLLRVLQTGEFERLGSSKTLHADVKVISATNSNLVDAISQGEFREDLYYRLNVVELNLLPLVNRPDDILPLARHFIGTGYSFDEQAQQWLLRHTWPGNVRELENTCKRALVFASSELITLQALTGYLNVANTAAINHKRVKLTESSAVSEKLRIQHALDKHQWTIARAASELNLSRQTLYRRIEKYQIKEN
jgi:DNA-binding NtrC family response regulator